MWRIGIDCKMQQIWVFYRCDDCACMLHIISLRAQISQKCEILVWNMLRIGTNFSRAVKNWYQFFKLWNLRNVKFAVQQNPIKGNVRVFDNDTLIFGRLEYTLSHRVDIAHQRSNCYDDYEPWGFLNGKQRRLRSAGPVNEGSVQI